ncbi:uncharacterized protein BJ212DRAFT_1451122 [Suillus subaureus]|uniref:Uncharacterized protein n=1 Tax=Suillus subaureus TaxID=48587 RepID=A0A9P7AME5_9AGAM|nr:uncharacterized protein BJ212DRAFT_1451122 [Suillus subaureus]KAG1792533.1 hypothetical protein BJ212DRAFT_1451122 [Suillus subaureus]
MDNVLGNILKQWNKHHTIYMLNVNLPCEILKKEFFSGIVMWDCKDEEVILIPCGLFLAGDNSMQAKECSHAGLNCNYFCRTCDVSGTKEYKASEEGYNSIFKINMHLDMPTKTLHIILLGVVKYFWGQSVFLLEKEKLLHIFQSCLKSVNKDRLNIPSLNADYICHYKGNLIGKHFKSLAQVMPFLTVVNGWSVIGELVTLVWYTTIPDTDEYLVSLHYQSVKRLSQMIKDFLNITVQCAPSILISKPKFHFLIYLLAFICHFGPAIIFSTKRYESLNHVF